MNYYNLIRPLIESPITWIIIAGIFLWKTATWKTTIENKLSSLSEKLSSLSEKVEKVYDVIINRFGHSVEQTSSPITLNNYGKDLSERIDSKTIVNKYVDLLYEQTKNMNAYQVQEHCFLFSKDELLPKLQETDKEYFDKISSVAFDDGIDIEKIARVIGIELRDRILSMHGKLQTEIDDHLPH